MEALKALIYHLIHTSFKYINKYFVFTFYTREDKAN